MQSYYSMLCRYIKTIRLLLMSALKKRETKGEVCSLAITGRGMNMNTVIDKRFLTLIIDILLFYNPASS